MIEVTTLLEKAANSALYGINIQIPLITRISGHRLPADVTIYSDISDADIADGKDPALVPATVISSEMDPSSVKEESTEGFYKATVTAVLSDVVRDEVMLLATQDSSYRLKAIRRMLRAWDADRVEANKELNKVRIVKIHSIRIQRAGGFAGQSLLTGFVLVRVDILDKNP